MIRSHRTSFATFLIFCLVLVACAAVPALAADGDGVDPVADTPAAAQQPADSPAPADPPAPVDPPAEPVTDETPPPASDSGETPDPPADPGSEGGATSGTGATGETGSTGPVADGSDGASGDGAGPAPPTGEGTPPQETSDGPAPTADGTITEDQPASRDSGAGAEGGAVEQDVLAQLSGNPSVDRSSGSGGAERGAAGRAQDTIRQNAENGVAASLVVTRIISEVPAWIFWALAALAIVALAGLALYLRERHRRRSAEQEAMVDELTGIANRKAFDRRLDLEWRRAARYGRSLGLMVMDLDGFKQVNDVQGHAAGDRVLRDVAQALDGRMRDTDLVARIGGDEFAIICPETGVNELMTIRRQLIDQVTSGLTDRVGLSIGVAEYVPADSDAMSILARADESMYRVKRGESTAMPA